MNDCNAKLNYDISEYSKTKLPNQHNHLTYNQELNPKTRFGSAPTNSQGNLFANNLSTHLPTVYSKNHITSYPHFENASTNNRGEDTFLDRFRRSSANNSPHPAGHLNVPKSIKPNQYLNSIGSSCDGGYSSPIHNSFPVEPSYSDPVSHRLQSRNKSSRTLETGNGVNKSGVEVSQNIKFHQCEHGDDYFTVHCKL